MSESSTVASAYNAVQMSGVDGRSLDAIVLLKAAARLQQACDEWDQISEAGDFSMLTDALRYNQRLWTIFQVDVASEDNPLPGSLKRNLLLLSQYVDRCTMQLLASPDRSRLVTLIQINQNLAAGLGSRVEAPGSPMAEVAVVPVANDGDAFDLSL